MVRKIELIAALMLTFGCGGNPTADNLSKVNETSDKSVTEAEYDGYIYTAGDIPREYLDRFGDDITIAGTYSIDLGASGTEAISEIIRFNQDTQVFETFLHEDGSKFFSKVKPTDERGRKTEYEVTGVLPPEGETRYVFLNLRKVPIVRTIALHTEQKLEKSNDGTVKLNIKNRKPVHAAIVRNLIDEGRLTIEATYSPAKTGYKLGISFAMKQNKFQDKVSPDFVIRLIEQYLFQAKTRLD